jgi:YHS domain-containing protein
VGKTIVIMKTGIFALLILCSSAYTLFAQESGARRRNINNENFIGLRQFDPVSYFSSKPLRGSEKIQYDYKGITYYFASDANLETFKKTPDKFEPAYGGWCAYTLATSGERVKVDPTAYKIFNGKLYLFYNFNGDNRLLKFNSSPNKKNLIAAADKKWKWR